MGGDILYRWGNPSNYNTSGSQIIPDAVHDVRWIENDGRPNAGFLQVFNNEGVETTNPQLTQLMQLVLQETDIHIIEHQDKHLNQLVILGDIHVHILLLDNPHQ